jgi:hypothetical protein
LKSPVPVAGLYREYGHYGIGEHAADDEEAQSAKQKIGRGGAQKWH